MDNEGLSLDHVSVLRGPDAVVHDVTLSVGTGEFVSLLGANGSGKTSLLLGIAGVLRTRGRITLSSENHSRLSADTRARNGIRMVQEQGDAFLGLTVEENLRAGALYRESRSGVEADLEYVKTLFPELNARSRNVAGTLSGGELRKLSIGRAMMSQPKALLVDELSGGLAPRAFEEVLAALQDVAARGVTILMAEQSPEEVRSYVSRTFVLSRGRLVLVFARGAEPEKSQLDQALWGLA